MLTRALFLFTVISLPIWTVQAQDVGVAAAVNQDAQGTSPSGVTRTIELGDNVVFNQRIDTDAAGLVQILLADGTAFTVGPNSSLTIDAFVYDPVANTASVAASVTKGFVRFIGGRSSKPDGSATIDTPIGTAGIRGAVADISVDSSTGDGGSIPPHISLVFGDQITVSAGNGANQTITEAGFSIVASGGQLQAQKTPPEFTTAMQQALTPKPGTNGGATAMPTNQTVQKSTVAASNSAFGTAAGSPSLVGYIGTVGNFDAAASWAEITDIARYLNYFEQIGQGDDDSEVNPEAPTFMFAPARVLTQKTYLDPNGQVVANGPGIVHVAPGDEQALYIGFNGGDGMIQFEDGRLVSLPFHEDQAFGSYAVTGNYPGTVYVGQNEFRAYMLKDSAGNPVYVLTGRPPVDPVLATMDILRYQLTADPLTPFLTADGVTIPFADGERLDQFSTGDAVSSDLYLTGTPQSSDGTVGRGLQAWLGISGTGPGQVSAIGLTLGSVQNNGGLVFSGNRAGSERNANGELTSPRGTVGTQMSGEENGSFFGQGGENIVIGTNDASDSALGLDFGTMHVGNKVETISGTGQRRDATLSGFVSGVAVETNGSPKPMAGVISLTFNAANATVAGIIRARPQDVMGTDTEWSFFNNPADSAYISNDLFAAHQDGTDAYMVSAAAVPAKIFDGGTSADLCTCDYLKWGWWGEGGNESILSQTHLGNWVIGDITDPANMPMTGTATYSGNAVGTVLDSGSQYIATGAMEATANFATGTGNVAITGFDGRDFSSSFSSTGASFAGATGNTSVNGAFAGSDAQNIMGSFVTSDGSWSASGIFGGAQ